MINCSYPIEIKSAKHNATNERHILLFSDNVSILASDLQAFINIGYSMNVTNLHFINKGSMITDPILFMTTPIK